MTSQWEDLEKDIAWSFKEAFAYCITFEGMLASLKEDVESIIGGALMPRLSGKLF